MLCSLHQQVSMLIMVPYMAKQTLLVLMLAFLFLPTTAEARRVALVLGNSAYTRVEPLNNPQNDAGLIADRLRLAGFEVTETFNANSQIFTTNPQ